MVIFTENSWTTWDKVSSEGGVLTIEKLRELKDTLLGDFGNRKEEENEMERKTLIDLWNEFNPEGSYIKPIRVTCEHWDNEEWFVVLGRADVRCKEFVGYDEDGEVKGSCGTGTGWSISKEPADVATRQQSEPDLDSASTHPESKSKFYVGQKVKATRDNAYGSHINDGSILTITRVSEPNHTNTCELDFQETKYVSRTDAVEPVKAPEVIYDKDAGYGTYAVKDLESVETKECTCDFHSVVMVSGCVCGAMSLSANCEASA